ncbi:MAG TPA: hypothetical protein VEX17_03190, partial [Bacillales bacterium]|nr:hypothetical protein [Bacillales bacterium]
ADVFVNPVRDGGGIKTKVVEALGNNLSVVSSINGSIGLDKQLYREKLTIVEEDDWTVFAGHVKKACRKHSEIPKEFFFNFHWKHITAKAAKFIIKNA